LDKLSPTDIEITFQIPQFLNACLSPPHLRYCGVVKTYV